MKEKLENLSVAIRLVLVGLVIFSIMYPVSLGLLGKIWDDSAGGSLIYYENEVVGSKLIGQDFDDPRYFHGRPSSIDYDAMKSGSKNLSPQNPELSNRVRVDLEKLSKYLENGKVPAVLITESGSALDPHITTQSAIFQIPRISQNTGIPEKKLKSLIEEYAEGPFLGIYGLERVNVLRLNIELKKLMEGQ